MLGGLSCFSYVMLAQTNEGPPNMPGKCYAKCMIGDQYQTTTEQFQIKAASSRTEVLPSKYENVTEKVLVKEASSRVVTMPASYETITEQPKVNLLQ